MMASRPLGARSRGLLFLLGALAAFSPLSIDMYLPSLPAIVKEFHASAAAGQATLSLFLLGLAGGQFLYGPLSDRLGRRVPLLAGIVLYIGATAGCVFSASANTLAIFRLAQGLGGCAGVVISRAVIADLFRGREAARALSMLMLVMGAAPILAPIAGAWVSAALGWRAVFGVQATLALVTGVCAFIFLPESRSAAVALQARSEGPLRAYRALLSDRRFMGYVLTAALCNASLLAYIATIPGLLVNFYGVAPTSVGWFFGLTSLVVIGSNQLNRMLLLRYASDTLLGVSVLLPLAPAMLLAILSSQVGTGLWNVMPLVLIVAAPFGLVQSNAAARGFAIEPMRGGSASSLFGAGGYAAGAISGWAVSLLYDGTPVALTTIMLACLCASAAACFGLARRSQPGTESA